MVSANPDMSSAVSASRTWQGQFEAMRRQLRQTRTEMRRRLADRDRQIAEQTQKIVDQERTLSELNRRIVEYDQRFDDIAAEVARVRVADVKQMHISPSDALSSSGESSSLPKKSSSFPASETSSGCQLPSVSVSVSDRSRSVSTHTRKRIASPQPYQSKHSKKSDGRPAATKNVLCLRSGRRMVCK